MFNRTFRVSPPEEAAWYLDADPLTGKDSWFTRHRFSVVANFIPNDSEQVILDYGCGNGLFLRYLRSHSCNLLLHGYDPYLVDIYLEKSGGNYHIHKSIKNVHNSKFNFITALDVIEHIEDDEEALKQINKMLAPDGTLLLTVPAYQWLYCLSDAAIGHYRRYTKGSVSLLLRKTGFSISHVTYFFCFLIPVAIARKYYLWIRQAWRKDHRIDISIEQSKIFSIMAKLEQKIMHKTGYIPCGTSLLVVAHKTHM